MNYKHLAAWALLSLNVASQDLQAQEDTNTLIQNSQETVQNILPKRVTYLDWFYTSGQEAMEALSKIPNEWCNDMPAEVEKDCVTHIENKTVQIYKELIVKTRSDASFANFKSWLTVPEYVNEEDEIEWMINEYAIKHGYLYTHFNEHLWIVTKIIAKTEATWNERIWVAWVFDDTLNFNWEVFVIADNKSGIEGWAVFDYPFVTESAKKNSDIRAHEIAHAEVALRGLRPEKREVTSKYTVNGTLSTQLWTEELLWIMAWTVTHFLENPTLQGTLMRKKLEIQMQFMLENPKTNYNEKDENYGLTWKVLFDMFLNHSSAEQRQTFADARIEVESLNKKFWWFSTNEVLMFLRDESGIPNSKAYFDLVINSQWEKRDMVLNRIASLCVYYKTIKPLVKDFLKDEVKNSEIITDFINAGRSLVEWFEKAKQERQTEQWYASEDYPVISM